MIRIENMSKYYGERLAVDNVSFNVAKGEVVGFLGPNGAGKTTTMRAITGYLMPSEGEVWVGEHNMRRNSLKGRQHIGYLPETIPLYSDMTTRAYLGFAARLRGLDRQTTKRRIDEVVDICHLEEYIDVITGKLSKGFRQRVGLAQAIIHDPEVLILDEPTVGIDPLQVVQTKELIKTLGQRRTILLSTHILPEVSLICERVIIIHEGRIVAEDSIENLSSILKGEQRLRLKAAGAGGISLRPPGAHRFGARRRLPGTLLPGRIFHGPGTPGRNQRSSGPRRLDFACHGSHGNESRGDFRQAHRRKGK